MENISIRTLHLGLGDAVTFAHSAPLWIKRGHTIQVECPSLHAPVYQAAGCEIVQEAEQDLPYGYPSVKDHGPWTIDGYTSWNKVAHNLECPPLPFIGSKKDLWSELQEVKLSLKNFVPKKSVKEINDFLKTVDGPLVIVHTRGNLKIKHDRALTPEQEADLYKALLANTDATLLLLDYDDRVSRLRSRRVRHLTDDFRLLSVPETWYLIQRAQLYVGIDSGPQHLTRMTDTPSLAIWFGNHPARHAIPRSLTANICDGRFKELNQQRRHYNNILDCEKITGEFIARQAAKVLNGYTGKTLVVEHLLDQHRSPGGSLDEFVDRDKTLKLFLDQLPKRLACLGCGKTTPDIYPDYLFGLARINTTVFTDTPPPPWCKVLPVTYQLPGSYSGPKFDAAFVRRGEQLEYILPLLNDHASLLLDNCSWVGGKWSNKEVPGLLAGGWRVIYSGFGTLLVR